MKARKKPVIVECWQFTRDNLKDTKSWVEMYASDIHLIDLTIVSEYGGDYFYLEIETLEGKMIARLNDYIIKGVNGEFYPCKPDVFEKTYEIQEGL